MAQNIVEQLKEKITSFNTNIKVEKVKMSAAKTIKYILLSILGIFLALIALAIIFLIFAVESSPSSGGAPIVGIIIIFLGIGLAIGILGLIFVKVFSSTSKNTLQQQNTPSPDFVAGGIQDWRKVLLLGIFLAITVIILFDFIMNLFHLW